MILKIMIAAKVIRSGLEQVSSVLEAHLFQYLESEVNKMIERETTREMIAKIPPCEVNSKEEEVCVFDTTATIPISITYTTLCDLILSV